MRIERVPRSRRNHEGKQFIQYNWLTDGRAILFIGWWKITYRRAR